VRSFKILRLRHESAGGFDRRVYTMGLACASRGPLRRGSAVSHASPWWTPEVYADRRPFLMARSRTAAAVRVWFSGRGFIEVETPALQVSPGAEAHLHAFSTEAVGPGGGRGALHLRTSPEFSAKKLLAAGEPRLFELAKVWRNRERGPLHHPEFTLLEWYRAGEPYTAIMDDCRVLLRLAAEAAGTTMLSWRGQVCDPHLEPERLSVAEAFARHAGVDLSGDLFAQARQAGVRVAPDDHWGDVFSRVITERIEPKLGVGRATILYEYPISQAALARPVPGRPEVAERFELYACGVELANCFGELTDAAEQRRRFKADMDEKERVYGERYPIDEDFLAALEIMPEASGGALGFDRLVMLATGARRIEEVLFAPVAETPQ
jgi:lysyl-tRNA synthetase class 2